VSTRDERAQEIKVFLVLFLQKKNSSSFSEEKEAKRLYASVCGTIRASNAESEAGIGGKGGDDLPIGLSPGGACPLDRLSVVHFARHMRILRCETVKSTLSYVKMPGHVVFVFRIVS
jgi:hypothetical protein